jgi:hypothetical protein
MSASTAAVNLQNQWYNTLAAAVGGNANFQIIQPNNPVSGLSTDDQVWQYFNNLPPASLNNNLTLSGGNQLYVNYTGVLSQLQSNALTNFQSVLGSFYPLWQRYYLALNPAPTPAQLPNVFYSWAIGNAPNVAGPGRSALQAALLDPIFLAQTMAANTSGFVNNTPNFTQGVSALLTQVANGGSVPAINFDSATASSNVTNTWAQGNSGAFFGIFGSSDSTTSQLTEIFASSRVTAAISFQKLITFVADPPGPPNGWYSSGALGQAHSASGGGAPWRSGANPSWNSTFGSSGNMRNFLGSLVVADGISATITSYASYNSSQQTTITQSSSAGFWPFYWGSGSSTYTNTVTFNASSNMTFTMTSQTGNPLIIGAFVLPAAQYLGGNAEMAAFVMMRR